MAGLLPDAAGECRLLDPGAGIGSLSAAFLDRWRAGALTFDRVEVDAYEIDPLLQGHLADTLRRYTGPDFNGEVRSGDFVEVAAAAISGGMFASPMRDYTHVILNPPYRKIGTASRHRQLLRQAGIEAVNLYSGFVALAIALTRPGGHVVAIIPRSFCNGPYYRPFREFILAKSAVRRIHLFSSRTRAFHDDGVLQENVIIHLQRAGAPADIEVSVSSDDTFVDLSLHRVPMDRVVDPSDEQRFFHIPIPSVDDRIGWSSPFNCRLSQLQIDVSTGPVVDFRLREHLRTSPEANTVPLLYPAHFSGQILVWPRIGGKKPNAILRNETTERFLYPTEHYCVVRRFSSKEERKRIVARVVSPADLDGASAIAFENHLNVFHRRRRGLPPLVAHGLSVYLNCTLVDEVFRQFNGHTQVNATDLRQMTYPAEEELIALGQWALSSSTHTQEAIDMKVGSLIR